MYLLYLTQMLLYTYIIFVYCFRTCTVVFCSYSKRKGRRRKRSGDSIGSEHSAAGLLIKGLAVTLGSEPM